MKITTLSRKIVRRLRYTIFDWGRRRSGRDLRHVTCPDFDVVVMANEDVGRGIVLGDFERAESDYFGREIKPGDCCFDVGANVGYFSMLMAHRASNGKVHVFEPIPFNAALVELNTQLNEFDNVVINNVAVSNTVGHTTFSVASDSAYSSMRASQALPEARVIDVTLTTLDAYVAQADIARVDILKVDVEGAEGLVIEGAAGLLSDPERRPRLVLLELYDPHMKRYDTSTAAVIARMEQLGYRPHVLDRAGRTLRPYNAATAADVYNVIFKPAA
jgi:FkbM family methyltransferase